MISFPRRRVLCDIVRLCWSSSPIHCREGISTTRINEINRVHVVILYSRDSFAHSIGKNLHRSLDIHSITLLPSEIIAPLSSSKDDDNLEATTGHRIYILLGDVGQISISTLENYFGTSFITDVFTFNVRSDDVCGIQWGDAVYDGPIYFSSSPQSPDICYWRRELDHIDNKEHHLDSNSGLNNSLNLVWCMVIAQSLGSIRSGIQTRHSDESLQKYFPHRAKLSSTYGKLVFENSPLPDRDTGVSRDKCRPIEVWSEPAYSSMMEYILVTMKFSNYSPFHYLDHFSVLFRQQISYLVTRGTSSLAMDVLTALVNVFFNALDLVDFPVSDTSLIETDTNQLWFRRLSSDLCRNISQLNIVYRVSTTYPYIGTIERGGSSADVALRFAKIAAMRYPDDIENVAVVARLVVLIFYSSY